LTELWIISLLVFAAVLLGADVLYRSMARSLRKTKSINRRLTPTSVTPRQVAAVTAVRTEHALAEHRHPLFDWINDRLVQTGLTLDRNVLLVVFLALVGASFAVWTFLVGPGLTSLLAALASALVLIGWFFEVTRRKRIARFAELFPDALDVIVRGVRAGYPLPIALDLVARELPAPIGSEFAKTCEEIAFGQDIRSAVDGLYRRVGHEDLLFFVVAVNVQTQTGGNLAEILARLSRLLRNRSKLRLKTRALSAEGRISAIILSLMPFILFAGVSLVSPAYFAEIRHEPLVTPALIYGLISLAIGNVVLYRMVHFRF